MTRFVQVRLIVVALLACLLCSPSPASADDCGSGPAKKVLFGTPAVADGVSLSPDQLSGMINTLVFVFEIQRERRWVEGDGKVAFLKCSQTGLITRSDLQRVAISLYYNGVVLDVRSVLGMSLDGTSMQVQIQYAAIPVAALSGGEPDGFYGTQTAIAHDRDFLQVLVDAQDIDAYVAAGLGLGDLDERSYDLALANLCKARLHLESIVDQRGSSLAAPQREALDTLLKYLSGQLTRIVNEGVGKEKATRVTYLARTRLAEFIVDPCFSQT